MTIGAFARSLGATARWTRASSGPAPAHSEAGGACWQLRHVAVALGMLFLVEIALVLARSNDLDIAGWKALGSESGSLPVRGLFLESILLASLAFLVSGKGHAGFTELGFRRPRRWGLHLALLLALLSLLLVNLSIALAGTAGLTIRGNLSDDIDRNMLGLLVLALFLLVVAPVAEELFFRGFVFGTLRRSYGVAAAALISGGLFGLAHFAGAGGPFLILPIAATGVVLALGYAYSRSIMTTIVAHSLFNLAGFLAITA